MAPKIKIKKITTRIVISVVPILTLTILIFIGVVFFTVESRVNTQINDSMKYETAATTLSIENELARAEDTTLALAAYVNNASAEELQSANTLHFIEELLLADKKTLGVGVWYAPFAFDPQQRYHQYYLYKTETGTQLETNYASRVDYHQASWYTEALKTARGSVQWSETVHDSLIKTELLIVSSPLVNSNNEVVGVVATEIALPEIKKVVESLTLGETSKAFLVNGSGGFITWFDDSRRTDAKIQYDKDPALAAFGNTLLQKQEGSAVLELDGTKYRAFYGELPSNGWNLALLVEEQEVSKSILGAVVSTAIIPIIGLLLTTFMVLFVASYLRNVTRKVNRVAALAASGDLSHHIEITEYDEFGTMEENLNELIDDIRALNTANAEALEVAQEASRAKSDFLARMSHEMRTPMNAIVGMTSIGRQAGNVERKDYAFDKIEDASTHLLGVINDILDMSKIESGKLELSFADFDFAKMLQRVVSVVNFRIEERKQTLNVSIDPAVPHMFYGDDQRLAQVIANLLSNAMKFTPEEGAISLSVELEGEEGGVYTVKISVSDTGIGLSAQQQSKLFVSFQQADSSTSRKYGGTGLGLAISKRIVELMEGKIWVESELGCGSTFAFTVKLGQSTVESGSGGALSQYTSCSTAKARAAQPEQAPDFSGHCILIAEDIEINREIICSLLESTQLTIVCAENGVRALEMFEASPHTYEMVFMDVMMPEMDGLEATRRIRALSEPYAQTVPIVAMTANVFREDVEQCLAAGMNDHVGKPIDYAEVIKKLQTYLGLT